MVLAARAVDGIEAGTLHCAAPILPLIQSVVRSVNIRNIDKCGRAHSARSCCSSARVLRVRRPPASPNSWGTTAASTAFACSRYMPPHTHLLTSPPHQSSSPILLFMVVSGYVQPMCSSFVHADLRNLTVPFHTTTGARGGWAAADGLDLLQHAAAAGVHERGGAGRSAAGRAGQLRGLRRARRRAVSSTTVGDLHDNHSAPNKQYVWHKPFSRIFLEYLHGPKPTRARSPRAGRSRAAVSGRGSGERRGRMQLQRSAAGRLGLAATGSSGPSSAGAALSSGLLLWPWSWPSLLSCETIESYDSCHGTRTRFNVLQHRGQRRLWCFASIIVFV